ncbi:MAG TPA: hypothetical protein VFT55_07580, partial [Planctomycetota bacterium]|nr:hypothetical protein [Planctomycetota bacterium]
MTGNVNVSIPPLARPRVAIRSLRDLSAVVMRHLGKATAVALLLLGATAAAVLLMSPKYESEAKLLVNISAAVQPLEVTGRTGGVPRSRESEIQSELAILSSLDLLRRVVEKLGPEPFLGASVNEPRSTLTPEEAAVLQFDKNMKPSGEQESNIIRITYTNERADVAALVLENLIELYLEKRAVVHRSPGAYEFLSEQLSGLDERLRGLRERLYTIRTEDDIYALDEQRKSIGAMVAAHEDQAGEISASIAAAVSRIASLQQEYERLPLTRVMQETSGENPIADHLRIKLFDMLMQLRELQTNFVADDRKVKDLQARIEMTERLLEKETGPRVRVTTGPDENRHHVQLAIVNEQAALLGLRARLATTQSTAEAARVRLDGLNHRERELKALEQEIASSEATRARYLEGVEQARIDRALEDQKISNISVVQAATRPMLPVGPGRKWIALIGVIVAAFAAMGAVFLFDYFDDSFHTPESVEAGLRIPVLASFPATRRLGRLLGHARDKKHPWNGTLPHGVERECRLMVARITAKLGSDRRPLVLGVTSSKGGVGVTSVAAFLAAELAGRGDGPVLLVDRDFKEQRLTRMLVDESAEAANLPVRATPFEQLHILPADDEVGELRELTTLRSFSHVVVDVPAVELSEHALADARSCDGVVFVVAPGKSHLLEAHRGIDILKDGGVR